MADRTSPDAEPEAAPCPVRVCAAGSGLRFTEYGQDWIEPIAEAQPAQTVQTGHNLATAAVLRALRIVAREITRWNRHAARVD